jgi:hypothetical protein
MKYLIILSLLASCASGPISTTPQVVKVGNINQPYMAELLLRYQDYTGETKEYAKKWRKKHLFEGVTLAMEMAYDMGAIGIHFKHRNAEVVDDNDQPLNFINYIYNQNVVPIHSKADIQLKNLSTNEYFIEQGQPRGMRDWRTEHCIGEVTCYENLVFHRNIAKYGDKPVIPSKEIAQYTHDNIPNLTRSQLQGLIDNFSNRISLFGGKSALTKLLSRTQLNRYLGKGDSQNFDLMEIFYQQDRYGEEKSFSTSKNFALKGDLEKQLLWGAIFLLHSTIEAERLDKRTLKFKIVVDIPKAIKSTPTVKLKDYIE